MNKKRILVVDDEKELVKTIQIGLAADNYEVLAAYDGIESIEKAQKEKPDLILLDILMPKLDGFQTLKKLKENSQTMPIPVIMLTAMNQPEDVNVAANLGAEDYITKPIDYTALLGKIKKALGS